MEDEIDEQHGFSADGTEMVIRLKNTNGKLTNEQVILELEYLINAFARADDAMKQPGVRLH